MGGGGLKSIKILLIRIYFFMGVKIRTFCSSTVGVGFWGQSPQPPDANKTWRFFTIFSNNVCILRIQVFKFLRKYIILNYCKYVGVPLNSA